MCAQTCNVLLEDAAGTVIFNFNNANIGTVPCSLQMLNTGQVAIVDALNVQWSLNAKPAGPTTSGTLLTGQALPQVTVPHLSLTSPSCGNPSSKPSLCHSL